MPASYIAPGVYSQEIDLALFAPQISTSILGLVGGFRKGPMNEVTFVSSRTQFVQDFGLPLRGEIGFAAHAAMYFLRWGNQLKVVRVGDSNAAKSQAVMLGDQGLSVSWDNTLVEDIANPGKVVGSIVATLTGDTFVNPIAGITVTNVPTGLSAITTRTNATTVTITLDGTASAHASSNTIQNLGVNITAAALETTTDTNTVRDNQKTDFILTFGDVEKSVTRSGKVIESSSEGGGYVNSSVTFTATSATWATGLVDSNGNVSSGDIMFRPGHELPSGLTASFEVDSANTVLTMTVSGKSSSHYNDTDFIIVFNHTAFDSGVSGEVAGTAQQVPIEFLNDVAVITSTSEGTWADGIQVKVTSSVIPSAGNNNTNDIVFSLDVFDKDADPSTDAPLETYNDVVFDDPADVNYVQKIVNAESLFVDVNMTTVRNPVVPNTYTLSGGNNGTSGITSSTIIGTIDSVTGDKSGLTLLDDPETEDINLLSAPGYNHDRSVAERLITISTSRMDTLAVLDTPDVRTAQNIKDYVQGSNGTIGNIWSSFSPLSSTNRAAIYSPWVYINDPDNNENIYVPPSVRTLGVFARNDSVAFPWFAAAGPNRGNLYDTLGVRFKLTRGDVELTYGFGTNVNPIKSTVNGVLIDGNKNLQRKPTLLQNIHIIRMLMYAEKVLATATQYLQWEPHDPTTWRQYVSLVQPFLQQIASERGITDFRVKCDAETNTPFYINRGQLIAELHMIPTTAVAVILNRYIIHAHGAILQS